MKKGRIVNYHGRGRKKTAKIAAEIRAVGAHLADLYMGSFAINPVIAFGTPRDKQTNFVPARCAATEGNRQHSPACRYSQRRLAKAGSSDPEQ
jgi:hypothetical protein